jgi:hypothetical protein
MIQCPCQVRCFCSIERSLLNFLNIWGAVSSQTVLQAVVSTASLSYMWWCVITDSSAGCAEHSSLISYVVVRHHRQFCRLCWVQQPYHLRHPVATVVLRTALADSLRMALAACFCCAQINWTEGEQETSKYVVTYQKHLGKVQIFVLWFCDRVRNVVCSNSGIWLKETSVIAAIASADSETKYITDIISPWTYGFAFLQNS